MRFRRRGRQYVIPLEVPVKKPRTGISSKRAPSPVKSAALMLM